MFNLGAKEPQEQFLFRNGSFFKLLDILGYINKLKVFVLECHFFRMEGE
jgi:hypothetical protein